VGYGEDLAGLAQWKQVAAAAGLDSQPGRGDGGGLGGFELDGQPGLQFAQGFAVGHGGGLLSSGP